MSQDRCPDAVYRERQNPDPVAPALGWLGATASPPTSAWQAAQIPELTTYLYFASRSCISSVSQGMGDMWKQAPVQMESSMPAQCSFRRYHKHLCQLSMPWRPTCHLCKSLQLLLQLMQLGKCSKPHISCLCKCFQQNSSRNLAWLWSLILFFKNIILCIWLWNSNNEEKCLFSVTSQLWKVMILHFVIGFIQLIYLTLCRPSVFMSEWQGGGVLSAGRKARGAGKKTEVQSLFFSWEK